MLHQGRYGLKNILEDVPGVVGGAAATVATSQGSGTGKNHFRQYWANFKLDLGPVEVTYIPRSALGIRTRRSWHAVRCSTPTRPF
ncbi:hypothetical protein [Sphingomonas sp. LR55]|uniref:hypothetical protein n=1 Tax=Sphingomonas sp. LR55 TaxID=3050231 RepID=UPI002FE1A8E5